MIGVELLTALLRLDTTNPPGKEEPAAEALESYLKEAGLETTIYSSPEGRPSLVARLEGPTDVPALVLLSHTDVVGVEPDNWSHDPFGAEQADGCIWGRGALDMKGIAAMHAVAAASLARSNTTTPAREVLVVAVADEEAGGKQGAAWLLDEHPEQLGFGDGRPAPEVLGEGAYGLAGVLDRPILPVALGEKSAVWVKVRASGEPGHGSLPPDRQAPQNLVSFLAAVSGYGRPRLHPVLQEQMRLLAGIASGPRAVAFHALGSRFGNATARVLAGQLRTRSKAIAAAMSDTITTTQIDAGYKHNVVPGSAEAALDCRVLPDTDPETFVRRLSDKASPYDVQVEMVATNGGPVSDFGPLYDHIKDLTRSFAPDAVTVPTITPAMTDVRYWRARGATGYGWVPLVLTPELLGTIHGHDERVPVKDFERAVKAMTDLVARAAT